MRWRKERHREDLIDSAQRSSASVHLKKSFFKIRKFRHWVNKSKLFVAMEVIFTLVTSMCFFFSFIDTDGFFLFHLHGERQNI